MILPFPSSNFGLAVDEPAPFPTYVRKINLIQTRSIHHIQYYASYCEHICRRSSGRQDPVRMSRACAGQVWAGAARSNAASRLAACQLTLASCVETINDGVTDELKGRCANRACPFFTWENTPLPFLAAWQDSFAIRLQTGLKEPKSSRHKAKRPAGPESPGNSRRRRIHFGRSRNRLS